MGRDSTLEVCWKEIVWHDRGWAVVSNGKRERERRKAIIILSSQVRIGTIQPPSVRGYLKRVNTLKTLDTVIESLPLSALSDMGREISEFRQYRYW